MKIYKVEYYEDSGFYPTAYPSRYFATRAEAERFASKLRADDLEQVEVEALDLAQLNRRNVVDLINDENQVGIGDF